MAKYNLVFEGGGAKGSVFVGALKEFEARGHTAQCFIGTSAGAITATLMAAGYNANEMYQAVNEKLANGKSRFSSFMDIAEGFDQAVVEDSLTYRIFQSIDTWGPQSFEERIDKKIFEQLMKIDAYRAIFSFVEMGGLFTGNNFLEWILEKLNAKMNHLGSATFSEFYEKTGNDLSVVASDTVGNEMLVLNHRTVPDCPVAWAVRMSMSIPFVWQEVVWDKAWGTYGEKDITGHSIVDGGVLSNFPINLLTSSDKEVKTIMGDIDSDAHILGLLIDEKRSVDGSGNQVEEPRTDQETDSGSLSDPKRLKTIRRIRKLINTMSEAHDLASIQTHKDKICRLPAKGYGTTEFDMSDARLQALINAGEKAMKEFFDSKST